MEKRKRVSLQKLIGRPKKFKGPSRAVTVTLPEDTIARLSRIDDDRARAIVRATAMASSAPDPSDPSDPEAPVQVIKVGGDTGMLTVPRCESLLAIPELTLVEIAPNRYLMVVESGTPLSTVEIRIVDRLDALEAGSEDRVVLVQVLEQLRQFRRAEKIDTAEVILVKLLSVAKFLV